MFRNQTSHRNSSPFSELHHIINNQSSHLVIHQNQNQQFVPLEKTRTFSHKKLTITSAFTSPVPNDISRKVASPTFEINKFYRPPVKANCILQSKKLNFEQSKVSLKLSNVNQVGSPQRRNEKSTVCIEKTQKTTKNESQRDIQAIKKQFMNLVSYKVQGMEREIISQTEQIKYLKIKIDNQEKQLLKKQQTIKMLKQKSIHPPHVLIARLQDSQKVLELLSEEVKSSQESLNSKIDSLICKVVQMNILNKPQQIIKKEISVIQQAVDNEKKKIYEWLLKKQDHITQIENKAGILQNMTKNQLTVAKQQLQYLSGQVASIEESIQGKKDSFLKGIQTKDSISYWETFDDYIPITTRSDIQIKNISLFAQDDYFFHPNHLEKQTKNIHCQEDQQESKLQSINNLKQTGSFKQQCTFETENQRSALNNILSLMQHLKNKHEGNLPLRCKLDNYNRIINPETKKVLQNQDTLTYYKINELQKNILVNRGYLHILE